jgi:DNA-binding NarL/FixJ family response regulator
MAEQAPITVALGRFDDLLARGLRSLVDEDPSLELVAFDVTHERLGSALRTRRPRVAILDGTALRSPAEIRELSERHPGTRVLLLASQPSGIESAQLLAFGAAGCLSKATQSRDVLNAIHLASRGLQVVPRHSYAASPAGSHLLTARESDVLAQLHQRRSNSQIAATLHISIETVRTHARHIYRKLGVSSRRELVGPVHAEERRSPVSAR